MTMYPLDAEAATETGRPRRPRKYATDATPHGTQAQCFQASHGHLRPRLLDSEGK